MSGAREAAGFRQNLLDNVAACEWEPHPLYSVFTQYDREFYLQHKKLFLLKYRCFHAVSRTIAPRVMIELGVCGGAGADAYLSATPDARYIGIDLFPVNTLDGSPWDPYETARRLLDDRGFTDYELIRADLRQLTVLPRAADLVIVDGAHDFDNEYADLKLALTANPRFIFVDDSDDPANAQPAIEHFLEHDVKDRIEFTVNVRYAGGGLVIKLAA